MTLLLDTADSSRLWDTSAARLGLATRATSAPTPATRAALPEFRPQLGLPAPSAGGGLVLVVPPQDQFDTLMARVTDGQLGWDWFADRVWTLDYPGRKLWLQSQAAPPSAGAHDVQIGFAVDAGGRRIRQVPRIGVEIDGESWNMLFDTGATAWITETARQALGDHGPAERPWSLMWQTVIDGWRTRHPDWRYVDDADRVSHASMILVPTVRIAGFEVGPVWFGSLAHAITNPPATPPGAPVTERQIVGTIGGNVLGHFVINVDYPGAVARFSQPAPGTRSTTHRRLSSTSKPDR